MKAFHREDPYIEQSSGCIVELHFEFRWAELIYYHAYRPRFEIRIRFVLRESDNIKQPDHTGSYSK